MGEHIGAAVFRVKNLTIQHQGGTFASFVRKVQDIINPLTEFFRNTNNNYTRFNYLGEWHSHPSFVPEPSARDRETMRSIVDDPQVGANFAILMIVRLNTTEILEGSITVFQPGNHVFKGELIKEEYDD